ncbi:unnamed protein product [Urochloa decumbens]|uniref:Uncharacterized protein n=1 Tax=Urochloa decumbens TaxID=240449 RepID=A0ABC8ZD49_9POAL
MRSSLGFEMVTGSGGNVSELEAARGAPKLHHQAGFGRALLGLAAVSTAINLAVIEPPPCLDRNAYFVPLSGMFFAGMTQVIATVWVAGGRDHAVGIRKLVNVMYASLVVAAGLTAASLLL